MFFAIKIAVERIQIKENRNKQKHWTVCLISSDHLLPTDIKDATIQPQRPAQLSNIYSINFRGKCNQLIVYDALTVIVSWRRIRDWLAAVSRCRKVERRYVPALQCAGGPHRAMAAHSQTRRPAGWLRRGLNQWRKKQANTMSEGNQKL